MQVIKLNKNIELSKKYSQEILLALSRIIDRGGEQLYLVGGSVRDLFLERISHDLDCTVSGCASLAAKLFVDELKEGTIIDLSGPNDETFRVIWRGKQVDFSSFRAGTKSIEEDLLLRDFTVNSMAISFTDLLRQKDHCMLLDPLDGLGDLQNGRLKHCSGAFVADPVRMLRGYRLCATLGFYIDEKTTENIKRYAPLITNIAAERINHEMRGIFNSSRTAETVQKMNRDGLFCHLLPELCHARGVEQPEFHHLDVLQHCFLALAMMEDILANPQRFFPAQGRRVAAYLRDKNIVRCLKWAALMHDIGKPATQKIRTDKNDRVTFYNHDKVGGELMIKIANRLKWTNSDTECIGRLIGMHMHPFHLCNVQREGKITKRSVFKLCRRAKNDLLGLFLLAMSDSLASQGEKKPQLMEEELTCLLDTAMDLYDKDIKPVLQGPRLVTGKDLIDQFDLVPGPSFAKILNGLETARVEGAIANRQAALDWVENYCRR